VRPPLPVAPPTVTGMFGTACRYPVATSEARDALAAASGLVLATLVLVRAGRALWPDALAVVALGLAAVPAVVFAGLLGSVLRADAGDPGPPRIGPTALPVRAGLTVVVLAGVYLVGPTVVLLGTVVALQNATSGGMGRTGVAVAGTSAMVLALALGYALPAALAAGSRNGLRPALRVRSLPGLQSGAYFAAWAGAGVLVVLGWTALGVAGTGTALAVVAALWFAYTHLAAARLVHEGVTRATGRA